MPDPFGLEDLDISLEEVEKELGDGGGVRLSYSIDCETTNHSTRQRLVGLTRQRLDMQISNCTNITLIDIR